MSGLGRIRSFAAPVVKSALLRAGGYAVIRRLRPNHGLAILRYHAICGSEGYAYADPAICITPDNFARHIEYLTQAYSVVRLDEAAARLTAGDELPPNAVAITFDDGYADNLDAARTLARFGATATFYITAGCLADGDPFWPAELRYLVAAIAGDRLVLDAAPVHLDLPLRSPAERYAAVKRLTRTFKSHPIGVRETLRRQLRDLTGATMPTVMLSWDGVREMHRLGMTIGSHTMTHPNLPSAGLDAARTELAAARSRLEQEIEAPVTMFSYPNGGAEVYVTRELQQVVRDTGYLAATTSRNGFADRHSDVYALERVEVQESLQDLVFALEVERFVMKPVSPAATRAEATS